MKKEIFLLSSSFILGLFLFPVTTHASELTLKDYGNGFYLPTTFELKGADGSMLTAPTMDPSVWKPGTWQEKEEMELDNGMTATKWWKKAEDGKAYPCISVYDEEGTEVFRAGRDMANQLVVFMEDSAGNTLYSDYTVTKLRYQEGKAASFSTDNACPRSMEQFDASSNSTHRESYTYDPDGKEEPIITAYDSYWDENGFSEKNQMIIEGQVVSEWKDGEGIFFEDFEYSLREPASLTKEQWKSIEPCFQEGDYHICPAYTYLMAGQTLEPVKILKTREDGEVIESIMYFTQAHIEIMEDEDVMVRRSIREGEERVIHYDVILKKCPLYLYDELLASPTITVARSAKAEEMFRKQDEYQQKLKDAVVKGTDRMGNVSETDGTAGEGTQAAAASSTMINGNTSWTQKIVGDVVAINGMVPEYCITMESNGHVLLNIYDRDYNFICGSDNGTDKGFTDYQYVYFTMVSIIDNGGVILRVDGTNDAGMSGNLGHINNGQTETDNGMSGVTDYY